MSLREEASRAMWERAESGEGNFGDLTDAALAVVRRHIETELAAMDVYDRVWTTDHFRQRVLAPLHVEDAA